MILVNIQGSCFLPVEPAKNPYLCTRWGRVCAGYGVANQTLPLIVDGTKLDKKSGETTLREDASRWICALVLKVKEFRVSIYFWRGKFGGKHQVIHIAEVS